MLRCFDRLKATHFEANGDLRLIDRFRGQFVDKNGRTRNYTPPCDVEGCVGRAMALFADKTNKAFCLCPRHEEEATRIPQEQSHA